MTKPTNTSEVQSTKPFTRTSKYVIFIPNLCSFPARLRNDISNRTTFVRFSLLCAVNQRPDEIDLTDAAVVATTLICL